jgi:predicted ATPase
VVPDEIQTLLKLVDAVRLEIDGLRDHDDLLQAVGRFLDARIPNFFYFSDYSALPGKVRLDKVAATSSAPASDHMQTARALLELAGTEPGSLAEDDYEERKAELEAVSNELTQQTQEYWRQSAHLEIVMDVEKENIARADGTHAVAKVLHIRVKDRRHQYTGSFDDRSSGFRWFFSFLAAFSEFENRDEPTIILLDEPALTLHGKAQADFLRFIEERLAPKCQVIYTTHSPFMVDTGHMDRVRIVEDTGPERGSKTTSDVMGVGAESVFPLQGALGYDLAQSIFIGPHNLLVEGTSDWTYLTVLSDHLASMGRQGLSHKWRLLPVGGMANVPTFVALLGKQLEVTVLVDSGTDGMQRINAMISKGLLKDKRLVQVKGIVDNANADIEDVFAVSDYLTLYNRAFSASLTEPDLPPGDRVVRRIAGATTGENFDHGKPADVLLRDRTSILGSLTSVTLDRFEALFQTLNATNPDL